MNMTKEQQDFYDSIDIYSTCWTLGMIPRIETTTFVNIRALGDALQGDDDK